MVETEQKKEPIWKATEVSKDDRKKVFSIALILIVVLVIILAIFIATLPPLKRIIYSDLRLDGIQTQRVKDEYIDENTTSTDLEVIIYLTNDGKLDSGEIKIDGYIKTFDSRGDETPCDSKDTLILGTILSDTTSIATLNFTDLEIRNEEKYIINFFILEDNKVVETASTTIKVPYVDVKPKPDVDYSQDAEDEPGRSKETEDDKMGVPGFEIFPSLIAIAALLIVIRIRRRVYN